MKHLMLMTLVTILSTYFFSCGNEPTDPNDLFEVKGNVTDHNGNAVSMAKVSIDQAFNWTEYTSEDGTYKINDVSKGTHDLEVEYKYDDTSYVVRNEQLNVNSDVALAELRLPNPVNLETPTIKQQLTLNQIQLCWSVSVAEDFREYKLYKHNTSGLDESTGTLIHVATLPGDTSFTDFLPHSTTVSHLNIWHSLDNKIRETS
nr:carboxypeptidase regulatory-like domain-containing protein [FCB group bacterium]